MRAPDFWWRPTPSPAACLLAPLGAVWGAVAGRRLREAPQTSHASLPVICVGNPVAGGAGKTPAALEIARLLIARGSRPVFLTRGYGGKLNGPVLVDPARHSFRDVGDEPLLLARTAPCVVARDRVAGAEFAAAYGDVIVMDDGFQNPSLHKDVSLLVVDAAVGIGNGLCIPAGPLRAPFDVQMQRAHGIVLVGEGEAFRDLALRYAPMVMRARLTPAPTAVSRLKGRGVLAFAGIGRPQKFAETLRALGARVERLAAFPDHHAFSAKDAEPLLREAREKDLILVTTEKDHVRLTAPGLQPLAKHAMPVPIRLGFTDERDLSRLLDRLTN
jgi:tetraacyldisaccharide 4'-kinase